MTTTQMTLTSTHWTTTTGTMSCSPVVLSSASSFYHESALYLATDWATILMPQATPLSFCHRWIFCYCCYYRLSFVDHLQNLAGICWGIVAAAGSVAWPWAWSHSSSLWNSKHDSSLSAQSVWLEVSCVFWNERNIDKKKFSKHMVVLSTTVTSIVDCNLFPFRRFGVTLII